jgi:hypothetical protein
MNIFAIFLLLSPLLNGSLIFSGKVDGQIRSALLESLKRSSLDEKPLVEKIPFNDTQMERASRPKMTSSFASLSFDVMQFIFSEFSDFQDICQVSHLSSSFKYFVEKAVLRRLVTFHPHFATNYPLLNVILYRVLSEHFRDVYSVNDSLIYDHLSLFTAKYFFNDLDFDAIPANIYHYIVCFIHEIIYKTSLRTPNSKDQFLNQFVSSLLTRNYPLEKSFNYILSKYREDYLFDSPSACEDLEFFYGKPSLEDIKTRFSISDWNPVPALTFSGMSILKFEFRAAIMEAFLHEFTTDQLVSVFTNFSGQGFGLFSDKLISVIMENEEFSSRTFLPSVKYCAVLQEARRKFNCGDLDLSSSYNLISDLNYTNIDLIAESIDGNHLSANVYLFEIISEQTWSLCHIELFSRLVHLNIPKLVHMFNSRINGFHLLLVELFMKESSAGPLEFPFCEIIFFQSTHRFEYLRLFLLFRINDPFILLYFPFELLKEARKLIQDKFDLHWHYQLSSGEAFDFESSAIGYPMRNELNFSFKQAINSFPNPELRTIFSSNPEEFDEPETTSFTLFKNPKVRHNLPNTLQDRFK